MIDEFKPKNMMDFRDRMDEKYRFQIVVSATFKKGISYPQISGDVKSFDEAMEFATNYLKQWHFDDKVSITIWGLNRDTNKFEYRLDMTSTADYKPKPFGMPEGEWTGGTYMREV